MVCYHLRLGGYVFTITAIAAQADGFNLYCHRGLGRWFATACDLGGDVIILYCHRGLGRWFSVAASCSRIKFISVLTITVASYTDWDGYCFIDAVRALFSDPLITGPGSSALTSYSPIEDAFSREGYAFAAFTTSGRSGLSPS